MGKGADTRRAILDRAAGLASRVGLEGLSIGALAQELELSKSGLFAHFQSKEALQLQVIEHAAEQFVDSIVRPALEAPRGEPRVRALWQGWLRWSRDSGSAGCVFVALATEYDDRPGAVRQRLVKAQRDWMEVIANCFRSGVREGQFRSDVEPDRFAQDLYGIFLARHHVVRLMDDPTGDRRAQDAFEGLLESVTVGTAASQPGSAGGDS
jgi:AcrR family transcriptional regulator